MLAPFVPGAVARYDEDWSPRAFGDNLTQWGTPVVLIESGAVPEGGRFEDLTRLNFVGLLAALEALARDDAAGHDAGAYETILPRNQSGAWADVIVRGVELLQPATREPYRTDLAFDAARRPRAGRCAAPGAARRAAPSSRWATRASWERAARCTGRGASSATFAVGVEGWGRARAWLDAAALARLARLGVGAGAAGPSPADARAEAQKHAEALAAPGRPRLELTPIEALDQGLPRLDRAPAEPRWRAAAAVLEARVRRRPGRGRRALAGPTGGADRLPARPRAGTPGLVFVAWTLADGVPQLDSVWLDGEEVARP